MKGAGILERGKTCLVVIDVQEKFRPVIFEFDSVVRSISKLVGAFGIMKVPVIVTEQNPEKLGGTVKEIADAVGDFNPVAKMHFSCLGSEEFAKRLRSLGAKQLVLCGIEAHVCVLKTALDALEEGFEVHVACDAVSSRKKTDRDISTKRYLQSGVFLETAESVIFQLMDRAGTEEFREVSRLIK